MNNITKIYAKPNQTIWDVALEQFGGIEAVWDVIDQNEAVTSVNYNISTAEELKLPKGKVYNNDVLMYYKTKGIYPAGGSVAINEDECNGLLTEDGECLTTEDGETIIY